MLMVDILYCYNVVMLKFNHPPDETMHVAFSEKALFESFGIINFADSLMNSQ